MQEKQPEIKKSESDCVKDKGRPKPEHTAEQPSDKSGHDANAAREKAGGEERKTESGQKESAGSCAESRKTEKQYGTKNGESKGTAS